MTKKRTKILRDPVHGDIELTAEQIEVIDSPQFQRLRGIKQLGTAHLVYPGARHTRFDHSIGTCHMAGRLIELLRRFGADISDEHARLACLFALVHDITHIPFGHMLEDERRVFARHDHSSRRVHYFLGEGELSETLAKLGVRDALVQLMLKSPAAAEPPLPPFVGQLVTDAVCADLLDYLKRDAYFCGLNIAYDERVLKYFRLHEERLVLELTQSGLFRNDALTEVVNLLRIRYVLSERVYYHHTKTVAGAMLSRAVEAAIEEGLSERDLFDLTDETLLYELRRRYSEAADIKHLLAALSRRRLYKRAFLLTRSVGAEKQRELVEAYHFDLAGRRSEAEAEIAAAMGADVPPHAVIVYCPAAEMALKEADIPCLVGDPSPVLLSTRHHDEVDVLLDKHKRLWKLYVFIDPAHRNRFPAAAATCETIFGAPNQLAAEKAGPLTT